MSSLPANTAFMLVPGGFCPGAYYHKVTTRLTQLGYNAIEVDHPTIFRADKSRATFADDAEQVRSLASRLLDEGQQVVIVCTSYGGFVGTEAVKGLSEADRKAEGKRGGLSNLVYIGSLLAPEMVTCHELISKIVDITTDSEDEAIIQPPSPEQCGPMLMASLPVAEQLHYGQMLRPQAKAAFHGRLTYLGYKHVPTTFVVTMRDQAVAPHHLRASVDAAIAAGHTNVVKREVDADHCAMCSHPEKIVKILVEVASEHAPRDL